VNSIWEGSGNVICLDVLRAARREPGAIEALGAELDTARGGHRDFDRHVDALMGTLTALPDDPAAGRRLAQAIALALSASVLLRHGPSFVAEAFCASRLAGGPFTGAAFGSLPAGTEAAKIVGRAAAA
jgi:putative acyl-CoA dehydrogenase